MNLDTAQLIGALCQSLLYWIYVFLSAIAVYCLYNIRGERIAPNKVVMYISATLFFTITLFYFISMYTIVHVFVTHQGSSADRSAVLQQIGGLEILRLTAYSSVMMQMDTLMAYRLYIIYQRNIYIVLPSILSVATLVAVWVVQAVLYTKAGSWGPETVARYGSWGLACMSLSVASCAYSTTMIMFRIIREGQAFRQFGTKNILGPVLAIIVESALVYSTLISLMLVFFIKSNALLQMVFHFVPPSIGLNYSIIMIRVGCGISSTTVSPGDAHLPTITVTLPQAHISTVRSDRRQIHTFTIATHPSAEQQLPDDQTPYVTMKRNLGPDLQAESGLKQSRLESHGFP